MVATSDPNAKLKAESGNGFSVGDERDDDVEYKWQAEPQQSGDDEAEADQGGVDVCPIGQACTDAQELGVRLVEMKSVLHDLVLFSDDEFWELRGLVKRSG